MPFSYSLVQIKSLNFHYLFLYVYKTQIHKKIIKMMYYRLPQWSIKPNMLNINLMFFFDIADKQLY